MYLTSIIGKDISFLSKTLILHFLTQAGIRTDQAIRGGWYLLLSNSLLIAAGQEVDKPGRDAAIRAWQGGKLDVRNYWHHRQGDGCGWAA